MHGHVQNMCLELGPRMGGAFKFGEAANTKELERSRHDVQNGHCLTNCTWLCCNALCCAAMSCAVRGAALWVVGSAAVQGNTLIKAAAAYLDFAAQCEDILLAFEKVRPA